QSRSTREALVRITRTSSIRIPNNSRATQERDRRRGEAGGKNPSPWKSTARDWLREAERLDNQGIPVALLGEVLNCRDRDFLSCDDFRISGSPNVDRSLVVEVQDLLRLRCSHEMHEQQRGIGVLRFLE